VIRVSAFAFPLLLAVSQPFCTAKVEPTAPRDEAPIAELWQRPDDIARRDLFDGPWGSGRAPDPHAVYSLIERKQHGTNPGITVKDELGREWHVKQPPHNDAGAEGPIEVTLSRVLSAIGYYQPPVYFMPSVPILEGGRTRVEPGGRFRLTDQSMKHVGEWSWQKNPFVGTRPYQGLLVILMMFNSSDLKNENNALYEIKRPGGGPKYWYVVRDLGTALGETGRLSRRRGDVDIFEREPFITDVKNDLVKFNYHGWHQELFAQISPDDVAWACDLLSQVTDQQWRDAFRAGSFVPGVADRFIRRLHSKISEGQGLRRAAVSPGLLLPPSASSPQ
jgi:hypothetical protein